MLSGLAIPYRISNDEPKEQVVTLPRRSESLSANVEKPKPEAQLAQAIEDAKRARNILNTPVLQPNEDDKLIDEEERERRREERERELITMLSTMTGWVDELVSITRDKPVYFFLTSLKITLLQQAYKNQSDLETALTLTRSNLQLALANNEMLEEALKRSGMNGKDVGWKRWSEREGLRRSNSVKEYGRSEPPSSLVESTTPESSTPPPTSQPVSSAPSSVPPPPPSQQPITTTRSFFKFATLSRSSSVTAPSSKAGSPTSEKAVALSSSPPDDPPTPPPLPSSREKELTVELEKERAALKSMTAAKAELENELETLSQALFEEVRYSFV